MPISSIKYMALGLLLGGSIRLTAIADEQRGNISPVNWAPISEVLTTVAWPDQSEDSPDIGLAEAGDQPGEEYEQYIDGEDCISSGEVFCEPCGHYWFRGDYLAWWPRGSRVPPLISTTPTGDTSGSPTETLFGNTTLNGNGRSGYHLTLGYWVDCSDTFGMEGDYFDLGGESTTFATGTSGGDPVLGRPFFDEVNYIDSAQLIAYPGIAAGEARVRVSDLFESAGARFRYNVCAPPSLCGDSCCGDTSSFRLDFIGGYRYYQLAGDVSIFERVISIDTAGPVVVGTTFDVNDRFRASNEFNGGELGLTARICRGRWSLDLLGKLALGNNHQVVTIDGSTAITVPGQTTVNHNGGLLALPTNIGGYVRDEFAIIPQFGVDLGYRLNDCLQVRLGYDFLYWGSVVRAGDQIDLGINPSQIPPGTLSGVPRPNFEFRDASFWAQGLRVGLEVHF